MMMLPRELIENILANLEYDASSLATCVLASRQLDHARTLLFRNVRLASSRATSRLLDLLSDSPHLKQLITHITIIGDVANHDDLALLSLQLCGPLDASGRHHGAGPLCSATVIDINWSAIPLDNHRALLALFSCSSITSITLHNNILFFASYLAYVSPNLRALRLYNCVIGAQHPVNGQALYPPIAMLDRPAQITSLDLMGNTVGGLASRLTTFSRSLQSLRIFVDPSHKWNYFLSVFRQSTLPSTPLHTLSVVFASYRKLYHLEHGHISPSIAGWLGFDLSNPPFLNLRTLNVYADTRDNALPVHYSLFCWLAATLNMLSPQNRQFESVVVYLRMSRGSRLANLGSLGDWGRLLVALNRIESLARLTFIVKIKPRDDPEVEAIYQEFARLLRDRFSLRRPIVKIDKDQIKWPPKDVYAFRVFNPVP